MDRATLNQILISVNNKPQGVAREINPEMFMAILPQVQALAVGGNQEAGRRSSMTSRTAGRWAWTRWLAS